MTSLMKSQKQKKIQKLNCNGGSTGICLKGLTLAKNQLFKHVNLIEVDLGLFYFGENA